MSLAANIAAAPVLGWQPVLVAGWPPLALLLAVELLADHPTPAPTSSTTSPAPPTLLHAVTTHAAHADVHILRTPRRLRHLLSAIERHSAE